MIDEGNCSICGKPHCGNWASATFGKFYLCKFHFDHWIRHLNNNLDAGMTSAMKEARREELLKVFLDMGAEKVVLT
jgi:hypothetical protein